VKHNYWLPRSKFYKFLRIQESGICIFKISFNKMYFTNTFWYNTSPKMCCILLYVLPNLSDLMDILLINQYDIFYTKLNNLNLYAIVYIADSFMLKHRLNYFKCKKAYYIQNLITKICIMYNYAVLKFFSYKCIPIGI